MTLHDPSSGLTIDADFECGSAGEIRRTGPCAYEADPLPETVPDWFLEALQRHFAGAGVPREYACAVRVTSSAPERRTVTLRFVFSKTKGKSYMRPPYWVYREPRWRPLPASATAFVRDSHVDLTFDLAPGESVRVANKPYRTPAEVAGEMEDLTSASGLFSVRELGRTAQGRPILALESGAREETIVIGATMQPAEPASRPVLAVAHYLTSRSDLAARLLDRFRFAFLPLPNPDGAAGGRSVTNALGEVPMFSFGRLIAGQPAPLETKAIWNYMTALRPAAYVEFHTHYQAHTAHKLNPLSLDWFPPERHDLVKRADAALTALNAEWRMTPIERGMPLEDTGKFTNLALHFQTLAYCYQIYAVTEEATCAHAVEVVSALAQALAGPEWIAQKKPPRIVKG